MKNAQLARVRQTVLSYYAKHARSNLPWRKTRNAFKVLVSEVMLQQTQVDRVAPYYNVFLKKFPTPQALARAPLKEVLVAWSGLGYNRRARFLHEAAKIIVRNYGGKIPVELATLKKLPGIGDYTAKAVLVFAHNKQEVLLETNIRAVILHHCFPNKKEVHDTEVYGVAVSLAKGQDPRIWHAALMDYGSYLKKTAPNPSRKSRHHVRQKPFKGSVREVRGAVLKELHVAPHTKHTLLKTLPKAMHERLNTALEGLVADGLIKKQKQNFFV